MKEQTRAEPRFSLCGLNCGLCPMYHISETEHCTGCGGAGRPARCSGARGSTAAWNTASSARNIPVPVTPGPSLMDSFVPHRNVQRDFARAARDGLDAYRAMLEEKEALLRFLLREYNDGRRKSLFCTAVNLPGACGRTGNRVPLLRRQTPPDAALREKGALAARLLQEAAAANGICLKLNRKKK